MTVRDVVVAATVAGIAMGPCASPARAEENPYPSRREAAVKRCEAISAKEYQTGLFFNPDGYRSYYVRSQCFQDAAVLFRDRDLCDEVRRRWSLFSSSWGYSAANCRKLVATGLERDRRELVRKKAAYAAGPVRVVSLRVERNGNGRDIDLVPSFAPGLPGSYHLRVEVIDGAGIVIDSTGYYLRGNDNIRGFVRQSDLRALLPGYAPGRTYHLRATLVYDVGFGGQSGMWSDAFIERIFPASARTQVTEFDAVL
jgi:hypothetical protein